MHTHTHTHARTHTHTHMHAHTHTKHSRSLVVANVRVQGSDKHEGVAQMLVNHALVGLDPNNTAVRKRAARV